MIPWYMYPSWEDHGCVLMIWGYCTVMVSYLYSKHSGLHSQVWGVSADIVNESKEG